MRQGKYLFHVEYKRMLKVCTCIFGSYHRRSRSPLFHKHILVTFLSQLFDWYYVLSMESKSFQQFIK